MGTRAVYGFIKDGKYKVTHTNFDGGYKDLGNKIVKFINTTSLEKMNEVFEKIILVETLDIPTNKQIEECKNYARLDISLRKLTDFSCLLAKTKGDLFCYRDEELRYMINDEDLLHTEPNEYIIDLDKKQLTIYWYEKLIKSYDLSGIPEKWIEECNIEIDICCKKYEEKEGKNYAKRNKGFRK